MARRSTWFLVLACSACGPAPAPQVALPRAVVSAATVVAPPPCPPLRDPDGWFALGNADSPSPTYLGPADNLGNPRALVGISPAGAEWAALHDADGNVRVGQVAGGGLVFERVTGFDANVGPLALGFEGESPILVEHGLQATRSAGSWQARKLEPPPKVFAFAPIVVDRGGVAWTAVVEFDPPPRIEACRNGFDCMPSPPPPHVWARLHVARLFGNAWKELPVRPMSALSRYAQLVVDEAGTATVLVTIDPPPGGEGSARTEGFHLDKNELKPGWNSPPWDSRLSQVALRGTHKFGTFKSPDPPFRFAFVEAEGDGPLTPLGGTWPRGVAVASAQGYPSQDGRSRRGSCPPNGNARCRSFTSTRGSTARGATRLRSSSSPRSLSRARSPESYGPLLSSWTTRTPRGNRAHTS